MTIKKPKIPISERICIYVLCGCVEQVNWLSLLLLIKII